MFYLGFCLEKAGRDKEAIESYFKVIYSSLSNESEVMAGNTENYKIKAYFRIARIYEKENNSRAAKKIYNEIIDLGPKEAKIARARLRKLEEE